MPTKQIRYFELEDRPIALIDPDTAFLFSSRHWEIASIQLARKTYLEGSELTSEQFVTAFPAAGATELPIWLILQALDRPH